MAYRTPRWSMISPQKYVVKIHQIITLGPALVPLHQLTRVNGSHQEFHSSSSDRILAKL